MSNDTTLRAIREAAGLTQEALSERCRKAKVSISQARISEYESGAKFPGPENVNALATALGVTPDAVFSVLLAARLARKAAAKRTRRVAA